MKDHRAEVQGFTCATITIRLVFTEILGLSQRRWGDRGHAEGVPGHPTVLETRLEPRQDHKLVNPKNSK